MLIGSINAVMSSVGFTYGGLIYTRFHEKINGYVVSMFFLFIVDKQYVVSMVIQTVLNADI